MESAPTEPWLCRPADTFGHRLWHVTHAWQRRFELALAPLDLTHVQFVVLAKTAWIAHEGAVPTQARIAADAAMDAMMISKVVRLLETKGFVTRATHPGDPRANRVDLTAAGRQALAAAIPVMWATQEEFFGHLTEAGQASLAEQLDRLLERTPRWPAARTQGK